MVEIESSVAHRFNAYASAAFPREIGGLLRVEHDGGVYRISDLKLFPHTSASRAYFELDGNAVADFLLELVRNGRRSEVGEWRGIIHSHPNMLPTMSGTDINNVVQLADSGLAFSLICETRVDVHKNRYALHAALGGDFPLVLEYLAYRHGGALHGFGRLSEDELEALKTEAEELMRAARGSSRQHADNGFFTPPGRSGDSWASARTGEVRADWGGGETDWAERFPGLHGIASSARDRQGETRDWRRRADDEDGIYYIDDEDDGDVYGIATGYRVDSVDTGRAGADCSASLDESDDVDDAGTCLVLSDDDYTLCDRAINFALERFYDTGAPDELIEELMELRAILDEDAGSMTADQLADLRELLFDYGESSQAVIAGEHVLALELAEAI